MVAARINVVPEQARAANVMAQSSSSGAVSTDNLPAPTTCQPGVFAFLGASVAAKAANTTAAAAALELRMLAADGRSEEAVCAYDEMNFNNRQSLELR